MKMLLQIENKKPFHVTQLAMVEEVLRELNNTGHHSFASLTAQDGSYLQIAVGDDKCVVEHRDRNNQQHFRAYLQRELSDQITQQELIFGGGKMQVQQDELLALDSAIALFGAFFEGSPWPGEICWRNISYLFD